MKNCWTSRLSSLATCGALCAGTVLAQLAAPEPDIPPMPPPAESFLFPIQPGQPAYLAGTMGEMRSTHYHAGIDIGTRNVIGIPVVAALQGYVSRISVSSGGYGNAIYLTHPDGQVTLYGHLSRFGKELGDYIRREQYRRKTFDIDLFFRNDQFVCSKGDTIALSGNTGSSTGPHLHFEVRNPNPIAVNPLSLGFTEISDHLAPVAQKVALKTLDIDSRINDRFGRFEFYLLRTLTGYSLPHPILASGRIGIEILAYDRTDNSRARTGINHYELLFDSVLIFRQEIHQIDLQHPRSIYQAMDYKSSRYSGNRFNKLYRETGNRLPFYEQSPRNGTITVSGNKVRSVAIRLADVAGNETSVSFRLKSTAPTGKAWSLTPASGLACEVTESVMVVSAPPCIADSNRMRVYYRGDFQPSEPAYTGSGRAVYLIDLQKSLPDSVTLCGSSLVTNLKGIIPSGTEYTYYSDRINVSFSRRSLLDTLYFAANYERISDSLEVYKIGDAGTPLGGSVGVSIKPVNTYPRQGRWEVYQKTGRNRFEYVYSEWRHDRLHFRTSEFGEFVLLPDTIPPAIRVRSLTSAQARFKIADYRSGVDAFEATLDGRWLLMAFDAKSGTLTAEKLNPSESLKGDLVLKVIDNAGNQSIFRQKII